MKISLLINMKMYVSVGIFIFISRENFMLRGVEHEKKIITTEPGYCSFHWLMTCVLSVMGCFCSLLVSLVGYVL